jgi:hypothetical protein
MDLMENMSNKLDAIEQRKDELKKKLELKEFQLDRVQSMIDRLEDIEGEDEE